VAIDSRTVAPDDLFVALEGPNNDAHGFVAAALTAGAAGAIVARLPEGVAATAPLVVVGDTQAALEALGRAARHRVGAKVVAVTGSVGKTSTKDALAYCLGQQGATHASVSSYNNLWGVPLTLARMPQDTDFGVFEVGMNHAGEIVPLVAQVAPHVALITTVEAAHLGNFRDESEIADAKAEIMTGLQPGGAVVLNRDNRWFDHLAARARALGVARIVSFGLDPQAEVRATGHDLQADGTDVEALIHGRKLGFRVGAPGLHWVRNALGVLATVEAIGADVERAAVSLASILPSKGRGQRFTLPVAGGEFTLVDDSYNANPVSMRAGLAVLGPMPVKGRRIAVLGDMLELGDDGEKLHVGLAPDVVAAGVDLVYTTGPLMQALNRALPPERRGDHAATSAALVDSVLRTIGPGDVVFVKGSLGSRMGKIVDALKALAQSDPSTPAGRKD
jgi:UDP-N-acetylmuramoyl-tripeptide--D-alanyl-D-alanine ligase